MTFKCIYGENYENREVLDELFLNLISKENPIKCEIPVLIDKLTLEKSGFFKSFPQQLISAAFAKEEMCESIISNNNILLENVELRDIYLTPSACLHIYPLLEELQFKSNKVLTSKVQVFRNELKNRLSSTRLYNFYVREVVLVGDKEFVLNNLQSKLNKALDIAQLITPSAYIKSANDSFYPNKMNTIKEKMQLHYETKFELIIPINGIEVAVASSNFHDFHFSKPFNFHNNSTIVTGCIGFGIDRWVEALKCYNSSISNIKEQVCKC